MAKHMKPEPFDRQLHDAFTVLDKECTGYVSEVEVGSDGMIRCEDFIARMGPDVPWPKQEGSTGPPWPVVDDVTRGGGPPWSTEHPSSKRVAQPD
ncbi:hypothetical protein G4B88_028249 [Cannabis sativa]|uniref:EF-hand domain-containing protein n=1 Tax=Cannabis sativa TaxID=3483 RepID=A0A7J6GD59_CANSA|nr:hypothetical protein G4B88_028249 [Cannabis sativa]